MKTSTQELILDSCKGDNQKIVDSLSDCFAVLRLEMELGALSGPAAFNDEPRKKMIRVLEEINIIRKKYNLSLYD